MWDHLMGTNYTGAGSEKGGARADHAKQQVNALLIMLRIFKGILWLKIFLDDHIVEELLEDFVVEHLGSEKRGEGDGK